MGSVNERVFRRRRDCKDGWEGGLFGRRRRRGERTLI